MERASDTNAEDGSFGLAERKTAFASVRIRLALSASIRHFQRIRLFICKRYLWLGWVEERAARPLGIGPG